MKLGIIFPGQGSQTLGMGKDVYDSERIVQEYFEEASSCLEQNFVRLCFASSERELRETVNAQTAVFLLSASMFSLLHTKYGITPDIIAGHSSGEYAAIFAAGGMTFPDTLYLLKKRAMFMEEATQAYPGSMIAVLGVSQENLINVCQQYDDPGSLEQVAEVVNFNLPEQLVVSGTLPELEKVTIAVRGLGGRVVPLNVAGAFHSRLMQEAEKQFVQYMVKVDFKDLSTPLVTNINADIVSLGNDVKNALSTQMSSHVLWWQSMQKFKDCDVILEIGPGDRLSKSLRRVWPDKQIYAFNTLTDLEAILPLFGKEIEKPEFELDAETSAQGIVSVNAHSELVDTITLDETKD